MYLQLGQSVVVAKRSVVGIFDLDNTTQSHRTRKFLERAEREGRLETLGDDLPKAFVVCEEQGKEKIYISQFSSATLRGRAENTYFLEQGGTQI